MGAKPPSFFTGEAGQNFSQKAFLPVGQGCAYGQTVPPSAARDHFFCEFAAGLLQGGTRQVLNWRRIWSRSAGN